MTPYVGYIAAFLGTICWLPQAWKVWATRDTSSLSLWSNLLILATVSLWLIYGVMISDWPMFWPIYLQ